MKACISNVTPSPVLAVPPLLSSSERIKATSTFAPPVREENLSSLRIVFGISERERSEGETSRMKRVLEFFWDVRVMGRGRDMWCVWKLVSRNFQGEGVERRCGDSECHRGWWRRWVENIVDCLRCLDWGCEGPATK
jgi:hypothetical protein